ncbi:hypothetical protein BDV12DRAFT_200799 [Aspergillus spectabilis]
MFTLTALSTIRMAIGLSLLCIPKFFITNFFPFFLPYTGTTAVAARMIGCRDLAIAALFYTHRRETSEDKPEESLISNETLKQALIAGIILDACDVVGFLWCFGEGMVSGEGLALLGIPAVGMLGLGVYNMRKVEGVTQVILSTEDYTES